MKRIFCCQNLKLNHEHQIGFLFVTFILSLFFCIRLLLNSDVNRVGGGGLGKGVLHIELYKLKILNNNMPKLNLRMEEKREVKSRIFTRILPPPLSKMLCTRLLLLYSIFMIHCPRNRIPYNHDT